MLYADLSKQITYPKLSIHKTGHDIADTVANAFIAGDYKGNADLVYGILRHNVFKESDNWFEVDKGYFNPRHYDGYYRISYKGTQAKWHDDIPQQDIDFELEKWTTSNGYDVIIPPTSHVANFFGINGELWLQETKAMMRKLDKVCVLEISSKNDSPFTWSPNIRRVITFNSSIGWQALQRGIPCVSDSEHSIVGSYYKHELDKLNLDYTFENVTKINREPLFKAIRAHQFTLKEIAEGKAWNLIKHYLQTGTNTTKTTD